MNHNAKWYSVWWNTFGVEKNESYWWGVGGPQDINIKHCDWSR